MERENREELGKRIREFLVRADQHFRVSNASDGTLESHAVENEEMIRQSNDLIHEIEDSNERQKEEDSATAFKA